MTAISAANQRRLGRQLHPPVGGEDQIRLDPAQPVHDLEGDGP